jgi:chromosome segregation ATPase
MTQLTDRDVSEIKTAIDANTKAIADLKDLILGVDKKIDDVKSDLKVIDTRLIEVEKKMDKQDSRLWAFGAIILTAALGIVVKLLSVDLH